MLIISGLIPKLMIKNVFFAKWLPRHQNHHAKWFSSKIMIKIYFRKMICQCLHWHSSRVQTTEGIF